MQPVKLIPLPMETSLTYTDQQLQSRQWEISSHSYLKYKIIVLWCNYTAIQCLGLKQALIKTKTYNSLPSYPFQLNIEQLLSKAFYLRYLKFTELFYKCFYLV